MIKEGRATAWSDWQVIRSSQVFTFTLIIEFSPLLSLYCLPIPTWVLQEERWQGRGGRWRKSTSKIYKSAVAVNTLWNLLSAIVSWRPDRQDSLSVLEGYLFSPVSAISPRTTATSLFRVRHLVPITPITLKNVLLQGTHTVPALLAFSIRLTLRRASPGVPYKSYCQSSAHGQS